MRHYMPEYMALVEWGFDQGDVGVYTSFNPVGGDSSYSYIDQVYEEALIEAQYHDPTQVITRPDELFDGWCVFTKDSLQQWAKGDGLRLQIGGFGQNKEEQTNNALKIKESIIKFFNGQPKDFSIFEKSDDELIIINAVPDPNGRLFCGAASYVLDDILECHKTQILSSK